MQIICKKDFNRNKMVYSTQMIPGDEVFPDMMQVNRNIQRKPLCKE